MEELMELLEELRPDVDFEEEKSLIDGGVLDSFDIISLIAELNETFDIEIKPSELVPKNFNSAKAIWALVERLQNE